MRICKADADNDGVRLWEGELASHLEDELNDGKILRNDGEVIKQGKGRQRRRIGEEQPASWSNVIDRVKRHAEIIHEHKKAQYERAKARIKEGGHHVVDRAGGGGVQDVPLTDEVIDFLEGCGEL